MTRLFSVLILAPLLTWQAPTVPVLWAGLEPGAYRVGYQALPDLSPASSVWYPTTDQGATMSYRGYLGQDADGFSNFLTSAGVSAQTAAGFVDAPMAALRNARPAAGSFPIVMVAQGNGQQAADQAVFCEYLASHGYLVVTTTSPMVATPMTSEDEVGSFAERQASDLTRAADAVAEWPSARADVRFVLGHSFGARPALLIAMRDSHVRGIVSLDGGIGTATAVAQLRSAPSFDATRATAPILHFYEDLDPPMTPDFTLLHSLRAPTTMRLLPGVHHIHFTTLGFAASAFPNLRTITGGGSELAASMERMAHETLEFLNRQQAGRGVPGAKARGW